MPAYRILTVVLMMLLAITAVELMAPGAGTTSFGSAFAPSGWTHSERFSYPAAEPNPVLGLHRRRRLLLDGRKEDPGRNRRLAAPAPDPEPRHPLPGLLLLLLT